MPAATRTAVRSLVAATAMLVALALTGPPAWAHTDLRTSSPAQGSTVEELDEVSLEFSGELLQIGAELTLVDSEGVDHTLEPRFPAATTVAADVGPEVAAGDLALQWRIVAEDGHPLEGTVTFTYAPAVVESSAAPTPSAATVEPTPASSDATASPDVASSTQASSPSPTATADDGADTAPPWLWPVIGAAGLATAAAAVIAIVTRRRS